MGIKMEPLKKLHLNGETLSIHLERKRKERGLSLKEISEITRIRKFYLEVIETGEFHKLPSKPYNSSFVRAYAANIGVDADAAVKQFEIELAMEEI